jgi:hypothetical protein
MIENNQKGKDVVHSKNVVSVKIEIINEHIIGIQIDNTIMQIIYNNAIMVLLITSFILISY